MAPGIRDIIILKGWDMRPQNSCPTITSGTEDYICCPEQETFFSLSFFSGCRGGQNFLVVIKNSSHATWFSGWIVLLEYGLSLSTLSTSGHVGSMI